MPTLRSLQWRAGQLPGQTTTCRHGGTHGRLPSMEGRTIARPDELVAATEKGAKKRPSMEGRTIARPDSTGVADRHGRRRPSMEGRTIARPDASAPRGDRWRLTSFNGGPDNCPARLWALPRLLSAGEVPSMEGRTIARPDLRGRHGPRGQHRPSMEGRTIARPDSATVRWCLPR